MPSCILETSKRSVQQKQSEWGEGGRTEGQRRSERGEVGIVFIKPGQHSKDFGLYIEWDEDLLVILSIRVI